VETEESQPSATPPPLAPETATEATKCKVCGAEPEPGYPIPLCSDCRTKLSRRPIPTGIKAAAGAVAFLIVFALTRIPSSLSAATSFERGLGAENRSDFSAAEREYQKSLLVFSRTDLVHGRLFVAAFKAGDKAVAREEYDFLENRPLDAHIAREINSILGREN
jgi:hypothetical protein